MDAKIGYLNARSKMQLSYFKPPKVSQISFCFGGSAHGTISHDMTSTAYLKY